MRLIVVRKADELTIKGRSTLIIKHGDKIIERALRDIDSILIIGRKVKISSKLPPVLALHNIPLAIISMDSIAILTNPISIRYNNYRLLQYTLPKTKALNIALQYIKARIQGMKNIIIYYRKNPPQIPSPPKYIDDNNLFEEKIRLWESTAASILWPDLIKLVKTKYLDTLVKEYGFMGRKPRHPDPFNKTLSVMYAVLYSLATKALIAAGLDPTYGFLHRTRYSTPLTFDYTEMFKPIAIHATIDMINNEVLPEIGEDGELTRKSINNAIKYLYKYLTLKHKDTRKTPYQQIYLKAFCLAKHLEGKCSQKLLTVTWNRLQYRKPNTNRKFN